MAGNNKSGLVALVLIVIGLFFFFNPLESQLTLPLDSIKSQLQQDYATYWADETDEFFHLNTLTPFRGRLINAQFNGGSGGVYSAIDQIQITGNGGFSTTQKFKGQEVVVLISGSVSNPCSIQPSYLNPKAGHIIPEITLMRYVSNPFNTSYYDIYQDGIKIKSQINVGDGFNFGVGCGGEQASVYFIGYKAEFSCDLSKDEVWIQDQFVSPFSIKDVRNRGFMPSKFCQETRPFVLRDLAQGERALERQYGIDLLNKGDIIPIKDGQVITVNYATFFVEGVLNPTLPNQANICLNRDSDGKCLNWGIKDIVQPIQIIIQQCQKDSDCPQPLRDTCTDYFIGCQNNVCNYNDEALNAPQCKNELVTIIKEIEKIKERDIIPISGENVFAFNVKYPSDKFNIGIKEFEANIDFICDIPEGEIINFPNPSPNCYKGIAFFNGKRFDLKDGDKFKIWNNINVTFFAEGTIKGTDTNKKDGLGARFIFVVTDPLGINIEDSSEILFESEKDITYIIKNNMPEGNILLKQTQIAKRNNLILPSRNIDSKVIEGINIIPISANTSNFGIQEMTGQGFYKLIVNNMPILLPSDKIIFNYNIVDKLSGINPDIKIITIEKEVFVEVPTKEDKGIPTILKIIVGIAGLFIILKILKII